MKQRRRRSIEKFMELKHQKPNNNNWSSKYPIYMEMTVRGYRFNMSTGKKISNLHLNWWMRDAKRANMKTSRTTIRVFDHSFFPLAPWMTFEFQVATILEEVEKFWWLFRCFWLESEESYCHGTSNFDNGRKKNVFSLGEISLNCLLEWRKSYSFVFKKKKKEFNGMTGKLKKKCGFSIRH